MTTKWLEKEIARREKELESLRQTLAVFGSKGYLNGARTVRKPRVKRAKIQRAIRRPRQDKSSKLRRREQTLDFLNKFDSFEPRNFSSRQLPALVKYGYLVSKDDGYVLTDKKFTV